MKSPLRYKISDLRQLGACKSNNSQALRLTTSVFMNDERLNGIRVQVIHEMYGVLYAYTFQASGTLITPYDPETETNIEEFLCELKKYGFIIEYEPVKHLPIEQLEFLSTLLVLGFDKIRMLPVMDDTDSKHNTEAFVVLFNIKDNPAWIDNTYCATKSEFERALYHGSAFNVSAMTEAKKFDWSWLTFIANIQDVIDDNNGTLWRF